MCELNLWGIETVFSPYSPAPQFWVWIEPVRDWNPQTTKTQPERQGVWIEPVRDWNYNLGIMVNLFGKCVNWTCEGLKLFLNKFSPCRNLLCELNLWGIETNFQQFHLNPYQECELNLWGIETHQKQTFEHPCIPVWIEPVRDWNSCFGPMMRPKQLCVNWTCEGLKPLLISFFLFS